MTDKQLVETFRKLKEYCVSKNNCIGCRFSYMKNKYCGYCQLEEIGQIFSISPKHWDMEEIERIINAN